MVDVVMSAWFRASDSPAVVFVSDNTSMFDYHQGLEGSSTLGAVEDVGTI